MESDIKILRFITRKKSEDINIRSNWDIPIIAVFGINFIFFRRFWNDFRVTYIEFWDTFEMTFGRIFNILG